MLFLNIFLLFTSSLMAYEVLGVGEACVDLLVPVSESFLQEHHLEKGGSSRIDSKNYLALLQDFTEFTPTIVPGGSCANTIKGLGVLGQKCAFLSKMSADILSAAFINRLSESHVELLSIPSVLHTTQVLSLLTPDKERTMRCLPGDDLHPEDLKASYFSGIRHMHIEGYALNNHELIETAMKLAKNEGATISLDASSFEIVRRHKDFFFTLMKNYVDILFANEDEAYSLTEMPPEEAARALSAYTPVAVVLVGDQGVYVGSNQKVIHVPTEKVKVIDSTGAGDLFASGFLHGFLLNQSLETCAAWGNITGGICVQHMGAELPEPLWESIKCRLSLFPHSEDRDLGSGA